MELRQKERLIGAVVLVILAVIFIPMLLSENQDDDIIITESNIPPKPESMPAAPAETDFNSRIVPLQPEQETVTTTEPETKPETKPQATQNATSTQAETPAPVIENTETQTEIGASAWVVQLGSFSSKDNAESLNAKLKKSGYRSFVQPIKENGTTQYRVRVGPELRRSDVEDLKNKIKGDLKLDGIIVQYP